MGQTAIRVRIIGCNADGSNAQYYSGNSQTIGSTKVYIVNPGNKYKLTNYVKESNRNYAQLEVAPHSGSNVQVHIKWSPDTSGSYPRLSQNDLVDPNAPVPPPPTPGNYVVTE